MTSYDDDGKEVGSTKTVYHKVSKLNTGAEVMASQESYDKKGKLLTQSDYEIRCENGTLYFDMKMMLPQQQADAFKDFEMSVEGGDKEIPSEMTPGSTMKDVDIKFSFKTKDGMVMPMSTVTIKITNRKIESKESITTPAGTFDCFKLSENYETKTIFSIKGKTISWFCPEVGMVKSESYKENGKFTGRTELTELK